MQDYTAAGLGAVAAAAVEQSLQLDLLYFTHQKSFKCDSDDPSYNKSLNGLFAANGHMVQSLPCWRASYALGHPKKKKKKKENSSSIGRGRFLLDVPASTQLVLQHGGFCTM